MQMSFSKTTILKTKNQIHSFMGRPRIGETIKKPSDYTYDYPEQREIARYILMDDRKRMAELTGYSMTHISDWCTGQRKNDILMQLALKYSEINKRTILSKKRVTVSINS